MKYYFVALGIFLLALDIMAQDSLSQDPVLKAEFIIKLVNNTEWPAPAETNPSNTVIISIIGDSPLLEPLKLAVAKNSGEGKRIEIHQAGIKDDYTKSKIVIIAVTELTDLAAILKRLGKLPVLTISDADGWAGYGVMIDFLKKSDAKIPDIVFAVNKMALRDAGLKISDRILNKAKKTYGG